MCEMGLFVREGGVPFVYYYYYFKRNIIPRFQCHVSPCHIFFVFFLILQHVATFHSCAPHTLMMNACFGTCGVTRLVVRQKDHSCNYGTFSLLYMACDSTFIFVGRLKIQSQLDCHKKYINNLNFKIVNFNKNNIYNIF